MEGSEWKELYYTLVNKTLNVSNVDSPDEIIQKIEISEKTHISILDRSQKPTFVIDSPDIGKYTLKSDPQVVYSWFFSLKSCLFQPLSKSPEHCRVISQLGETAYGKSTLCEYKNVIYVINQISKQKLCDFHSIPRYISERNLVYLLPASPFLLNLCYSYQDDQNYYLWLEYPAGGELLTFLSSLPAIRDDDLRFYIAEIVIALEFIHEHSLVFRDLSPANILLSQDGHIKLGGYGTHKTIAMEHTESEYIAPEVLKGEQYNSKADWWSLGVIMYQILFEETPFIGDNDEETKENILHKEVKFRRFKVSPIADLIMKLLEKDPEKRIDVGEIKKHPFFEDVNWMVVKNRLVKPDAFDSTPIDYSKMLSTDFRLDSELLPTSSAYIGLDAFSLGNEYSSDNMQ